MNAFRISEAAGLAIHAMTALARRAQEGPVKLQQLAAKLNASEAHLSKVMQRLSQAGLVASRRGPAGGFVLSAAGREASLLDVYQMFDGALSANTCLLGLKSCPFQRCVLGHALSRIDRLVREEFGSRRIGDLLPAGD
jgi:Rrf2 family protein